MLRAGLERPVLHIAVAMLGWGGVRKPGAGAHAPGVGARWHQVAGAVCVPSCSSLLRDEYLGLKVRGPKAQGLLALES